MLATMGDGAYGAHGAEGTAGTAGTASTEPAGDAGGPGKSVGSVGSVGLVGAGSSRVGVSGAMRARDVSRIRPEDLAEAERDVRIRRAAPLAGQPTVPSPPHGGAPAPADAPRKPVSLRPGAPVPAPPPRRDRHAGGT